MKWIDARMHLPPEGLRVLAFNQWSGPMLGDAIKIDYRGNGSWHLWPRHSNDYPTRYTHWMHLPEPPDER